MRDNIGDGDAVCGGVIIFFAFISCVPALESSRRTVPIGYYPGDPTTVDSGFNVHGASAYPVEEL